MRTKRINIAIKLDRQTTLRAIEASSKISSKFPTEFTLDGKNYIPHITLYSPLFPSKNIHNIHETLKFVAQNIKVFPLKYTKLKHHDGYIEIRLDKTKKLMKLHELIVDSLNDYREEILREKYSDLKFLKTLPKIRQKYIELYGYPEVKKSFIPHITFTKTIKDKDASKAIKDINWQLDKLQVSSIATYEMGERGTCTKEIKKFRLRQK